MSGLIAGRIGLNLANIVILGYNVGTVFDFAYGASLADAELQERPPVLAAVASSVPLSDGERSFVSR
jgi:hypothetical protein